MANHGKYYIAVRLLLLKQYLEANAGRTRIVKRRELEELLKEHDMPVEKKPLYQDFAALGDVCGFWRIVFSGGAMLLLLFVLYNLLFK